jgi:hypothetical protein
MTSFLNLLIHALLWILFRVKQINFDHHYSPLYIDISGIITISYGKDEYQTAQALPVRAQEIFDEQLSNSSSNTQSLNNIASALQEPVNTR